MSELRTRISLLYRSYAEWTAYTSEFVPNRGEVCFCEVPKEAHISSGYDCLMFKVGDGITPFPSLKWGSSTAADVALWAKKNNLDFDDLDATFRAKLLEYIEERIETTDTQFRIVRKSDVETSEDYYVWQLEKNDGSGWVSAEGTVDIKKVVRRMSDLETKVTTLETKVADYGGAMSEQEVRDLTPVEG